MRRTCTTPAPMQWLQQEIAHGWSLPAHSRRTSCLRIMAWSPPTPGPAVGGNRQPPGYRLPHTCARLLCRRLQPPTPTRCTGNTCWARAITDSYPLGLAVRHQCCFVRPDARLNLHAVPGAIQREHLDRPVTAIDTWGELRTQSRAQGLNPYFCLNWSLTPNFTARFGTTPCSA